jgi:putative tricarboxylic transport membrane protein
MDLNLLFLAFQEILYPLNILIIICSVTMGIIIGALPGLTATMACALLVPLTYGFPTVQSFISLLGIYCGAIYGGSVAAILLGIPGTPAAAATMLDGYPLTKKGLAGQALGIACIGSAVAGLLSSFVMTFLSPQVSRISLLFGPAEYFGIAFFALSILILLSGKSLLKGFTTIILGLIFTTIGIEPISGGTRFTFGQEALINGVGIIPVAIGLFGFTQVFDEIWRIFESKYEEGPRQKIKNIIPKWTTLKPTITTILKSTVIGTTIGIIPGIGPETASFIGYAEAKRSSKRAKDFGTGVFEGVAAAEAGNNGVTGGAMIPMLTLGVPGDAPTAILLGGLMLHGLPVGPMLFRDHLDIVYPIFAGFIVANIFMGVLGITFARFFARVVDIKQNILLPIICIFCFIGAYATQLSLIDVGISLFFGIIGFFLKRNDFPLSPMLVAVILGPMLEMNMSNALMIAGGNYMVFFTRPIGTSCLVLAILVIILTIIARNRKKVAQ